MLVRTGLPGAGNASNSNRLLRRFAITLRSNDGVITAAVATDSSIVWKSINTVWMKLIASFSWRSSRSSVVVR
jgi:hypothetical protein